MTVREAFIISSADVRHIRSYVQHKYAGLQREQHVEIVADAVSRVIRRQLPDFEEKLKHEVTAELIQLAVADGQRSIGARDIFETCMKLDRTRREIYDPLHDWIERQLACQLDPIHIRSLVDSVSSGSEQADGNGWERFKELVAASKLFQPGQEDLHTQSRPLGMLPKQLRLSLLYLALCLAVLAGALLYQQMADKSQAELQSATEAEHGPKQAGSAVEAVQEGGLPLELRYQAVDEQKLVAFLNKRHSILAKQPYLDAIVAAAKRFDVNPLLLFAITGQEQGFVPTTNKRHKEIANNPFNVFHSWQDFNTNINESAEIAARTVVNISKDRPGSADPFSWLNRTYAEDPNWSQGVRSIFGALTEAVQ